MASPDVQVDVVRRAQAGERAAFAELYEAYFDAGYAFCYQLTRSAAEVAQALDIKPSHAYVLVNRLKDTLEDAVAALVMMRAGPGACAELDAAIAALGTDGASRLRQAIGKHVRSCDACDERRTREAGVWAILATGTTIT